jgi:hypothetical protein
MQILICVALNYFFILLLFNIFILFVVYVYRRKILSAHYSSLYQIVIRKCVLLNKYIQFFLCICKSATVLG